MAEIKKPTSAYWLWLGDNRAKITASLGSGKGSDVAKKGGEMWKALSDAAKVPYEKKAKEQKEAYEKFIATEEGQKALQEKKAEKADDKAAKNQKIEALAAKKAAKEERMNERSCKAAVKAVEKDDALKRPASSYWLWLADNRKRITDIVGTNPLAVGKKGGEMWKAASEKEKAPYEQKAKEQKEAYEKYIASPEGAAALKAFKDATQAAKDQFKPKAKEAEPDVAKEAEPEAKDAGKKRKAEEVPSEKGAEVKKARGRPPKAAALGA